MTITFIMDQLSAAGSPTGQYPPDATVLDKYARVLVKFALNKGQGIQPGEVVECVVPDVAKPLAQALQQVVLQAGGQPLIRLLPTGFDKDFYDLASWDQLTFFPKNYLKAKVELLDHQIGIIADPYPEELKDTDPRKIMTALNAKKEYQDWRVAKEQLGRYSWTLALWGVPAKAQIVGLSIEEYWQQIIQACYLDRPDPVAEWQKLFAFQRRQLAKLNSLQIEHLHITGPRVDLKVKLGKQRRWVGGSGANIPSFEFFTSPDWRGTTGWVEFNVPLFHHGVVMKDIRLEFVEGQVTSATASQHQRVLTEMLKVPGGNKVGEFSLTDKRTSRISHFMAETLYDENMGGPHGNMHLAVGRSYHDTYSGDQQLVDPQDWLEMGFNDSALHTDIVTTDQRTVTATLADGTTKVIYKDGMFVL